MAPNCSPRPCSRRTVGLVSTIKQGLPLPNHFETVRPLNVSASAAFSYLDDHARLSAHMNRSSWMMAGSSMTIETDAAAGQALGSLIRIRGRILLIHLSVDEVVTERVVPERKVWRTIGTPHLLVIGHYRMGFAIAARGEGSVVQVFIDYALPEAWPTRWLGRLLGRRYARWCTDRMAHDAARHFRSAHTP